MHTWSAAERAATTCGKKDDSPRPPEITNSLFRDFLDESNDSSDAAYTRAMSKRVDENCKNVYTLSIFFDDRWKKWMIHRGLPRQPIACFEIFFLQRTIRVATRTHVQRPRALTKTAKTCAPLTIFFLGPATSARDGRTDRRPNVGRVGAADGRRSRARRREKSASNAATGSEGEGRENGEAKRHFLA